MEALNALSWEKRQSTSGIVEEEKDDSSYYEKITKKMNICLRNPMAEWLRGVCDLTKTYIQIPPRLIIFSHITKWFKKHIHFTCSP